MKRRRKRSKPPQNYMEASFIWNVKQLTLSRKLQYFPRVTKRCRLWWEWTEGGWRQIR